MVEPFKIFFMYSYEKDERFIENLLNAKKFCLSCGEHHCDYCREEYGPFSENIVGVHQFPDIAELPSMIEDPEEYIPEVIPKANVLIAINLHGDILTSIPEFAKQHEIGIVIVPVEIGELVPEGLERQVGEDFESFGIEYAFPRPFCAFKQDDRHPQINAFIEHFQLGYPKMIFSLEKNGIKECTILTTAPCGNTFYICKELVRKKARVNKRIKEIISKAHHAYPCNASMKEDTALGDTPLHIAGYFHREAIYSAILEASNNPESKSKQTASIEKELEELRSELLEKRK